MGLLSDIETIVLLLFLLLLWFITGIYMADASTDLDKEKGSNSNLASAQTAAFWGAFITLGLASLAILLIILLVILLIFFPEVFLAAGAEDAAETAAVEAGEEGAEVAESVAKKELKSTTKKKSSLVSDIIYFFLIGAMILLIINGILAVSSAVHIDASGVKSTVQSAYHDVVVAAVISLGTVGVILIIHFTNIYLSKKKIHKEEDSKEETIAEVNKAVSEGQLNTKQAAVVEQDIKSNKVSSDTLSKLSNLISNSSSYIKQGQNILTNLSSQDLSKINELFKL
jgi:hypothetical protein